MASSSTSSSRHENESYVFDVFINHRGPDVKKTLATDLYHRLCAHDLRVFLDQQELREGENITPQIESAIRTATVHVAIFSPNYADSKWCLDELVLMVDSMSKFKSTIIPVFYGVKPAELRWTQGGKGVYAQALGELQEKKNVDGRPRYDSNTLEKWRKALSDVAEIKGFDAETYNSVKTGVDLPLVEQLLQDVVEGALKNVKIPRFVSEYPKGLQEKLREFETRVSLQWESGETRVIGIVGLGGVGKTTLATEFYNRQRSNYKRYCFLEDIRDNPLTTLQKYILKDLTQKDMEIRSTTQGKGKLRRYLPSSDSLIILDDVDHIQQLEALLYPARDVLKTDSLILVTSRNKDVLTSSGIPESSIYILKGLNRRHSRELFCSHALGQRHPPVGFDKEVEKFLDFCHGLPLSIKVIGSLLRGKNDLKLWEAQFRKISNILPDDIQGRLKISYDGLDEEEKKIFLDIACFFVGEDRDRVIRVWNGSQWEGTLGLWTLENRCLVEVDSENRLRMHEHLRDLGRHLGENEPPDCELRLWNLTDNLFHKLSGQFPVRGISMVDRNDLEQSFQNLAESARTRLLSNMSRLQVLKAEGCFVEQLFSVCQQLPQLIYLSRRNCPSSFLPSSISINNLRVLHVKGNFSKALWQYESQAPLQLSELCIDAPLSNVPKSIGKLQNLEKLVLLNSVFQTLQSLIGVVGNLKGLQCVFLRRCNTLQRLPDSLIGNLTGIQSLDLNRCYALQTLPDSVGNLAGLQHLSLRWCFSLQMLPESVGNLVGVQHLDLGWCFALQTLPDSVGNLTGLQRLDLVECSTLQTLPDSVGALAGLQRLDLTACSALQMLPDSVGTLTGLQSLLLAGCSALQMLPDSFGNLTGLKQLDLRRCFTLQMLPDSVGNLAGLQSLILSKCSSLQTLPNSVGNLAGLRSLVLSKCDSLLWLPDSIGNLKKLHILDLAYCSNLQMLPNVEQLSSLENLIVFQCPQLQWGAGVVKQLRQRLGEGFIEESWPAVSSDESSSEEGSSEES